LLSAQITRWFRHFSIYIGGENLTGFKQKHPVVDAMNPWGNQFDTNMVWGPINGAMGYIGIRVNFGRL
jgi:outer membrane receptor for ferrienterochelin and colicins